MTCQPYAEQEVQVTIVLKHRVRYHEADAQGIMFNSRYLEVADVAMTEYMRRLGFPYTEMVGLGSDPSVLRADVHFKSPARFDDVLEVSVHCTHVGTSSFHLTVEMFLGDLMATEVQLVYVNIDPDTRTSAPLPNVVAEALRADVNRT